MNIKGISTLRDIPTNANVCLYGTGVFGKKILNELNDTRPDVKVEFLVDSTKSGEKWNLDLVLPEKLLERADDYDFTI